MQAFLLCTAFNTTEGRRFNLLGGGIESLPLERIPGNVPLGLITRFTLPTRPVEIVSVRTEVRHGTDRLLVLPPLIVDIDPEDGPNDPRTGGAMITLPIDLTPFAIEQPGDYWFGLFVDDVLITSTTLVAYIEARDQDQSGE